MLSDQLKLLSVQTLWYADAPVMDPSTITNPEYDALLTSWEKFRYTFEGGHDFVDKYLVKFSAREENTDFTDRKAISYAPSHAKASIIDIKNAIYQRMVDITRENGPDSYRKTVVGELGGVDLRANTMTSFIGTKILPEMLAMGKVGVYVDKAAIEEGSLRSETRDIHPYLYMYRVENIRAWTVDREGHFLTLLLRDFRDVIDDTYKLVVDQVAEYRLLQIIPEGVSVKFYDDSGAHDPKRDTILKLPMIPFVVFDLGLSLLTDVADYQIALLNLASSDINYALKSNYPFYTEQFNPNSEMIHVRDARPKSTDELGGESVPAQQASTKQVVSGASQGRRYPKGLERPAFIHPSAEPLMASMEKQEKLKQEIRQLVNLAITNIAPQRASAESKSIDEHGLEAGLSYIGLELEHGERKVGIIWAAYEGSDDVATISYPRRYSLRSDAERRTEAAELNDLIQSVPSRTYQKELAKDIATIIIGHKSTNENLEKVHKEIDTAEVIVTDSETIIKDHEAGLVGTELASKVRGYPEGEVDKASKDHADRAARIAIAQSSAVIKDADERGVNDLSAGKKETDNE